PKKRNSKLRLSGKFRKKSRNCFASLIPLVGVTLPITPILSIFLLRTSSFHFKFFLKALVGELITSEDCPVFLKIKSAIYSEVLIKHTLAGIFLILSFSVSSTNLIWIKNLFQKKIRPSNFIYLECPPSLTYTFLYLKSNNPHSRK